MGSNTRTKRYYGHITLHKNMKFYIKDFLSKCDQIRSFLRIWSYLLKKSLMEIFLFYAVLPGKLCNNFENFYVSFQRSNSQCQDYNAPITQ